MVSAATATVDHLAMFKRQEGELTSNNPAAAKTDKAKKGGLEKTVK